MERNASRIGGEERRMVEGTLEGIRRNLEQKLKEGSPPGTLVTVDGMSDRRGTLTAEFRTSGAGLELRSGEKPGPRHAIARLEYSSADSSYAMRLCPAIIPKLRDAGMHKPGVAISDEERMEAWRFFFGDMLLKPGITQIEISFGNLREISHRPDGCQCHSRD
jgi:hypothetical protein